MLAMVVNDDAGRLILSGVHACIASMLAPTGTGAPRTNKNARLKAGRLVLT
ncbi:hypothetical protein D3C73_1664480 [compost metagenome]